MLNSCSTQTCSGSSRVSNIKDQMCLNTDQNKTLPVSTDLPPWAKATLRHSFKP